MSNDVKSAQLGMSVSTARARLVKMLLFRELQRSGNDKCYRCGKVIDDIDHLSIEHKEPWLHASPTLFWDLDNVEFSHMTCNSSAARRAPWKYTTRDEARQAENKQARERRQTPEGRASSARVHGSWYEQQKSDPEKWEHYKERKRIEWKRTEPI
jgi:hypothetical protein